ncbi:DNA polymerase III, delta subunit [Spongiibacter sp. IMCC21906]|uniref:DNA polymerase III subunit delta n=1 Tax=Spongiibacter sp. IMCC21906 TaxID=1620392 RepID=UPI00062DD0B5|nr:DNA polymerase III subunit delta [Spongiibacter sp. IMCC21906]AKH70816.1 DNA polymerase III, delta subunit [Spongiibacter sp. IMCC21906]
MRLRPEQLSAHLQKPLQAAYLVTGDELLLTQEACDKIRQSCRQQGIEEREVLEVERGFDWNQLLSAGSSMSLFADRKLIELRLGGGKMDQKSSAALQEFLTQSDGSNILLVSCGRLDSRSMNAKWVKALDGAGAVIQVWPVERRQLSQWISQRMQDRGMQADSVAIELLADRVEGNLLAADQEIEKLRVLVGERPINADIVASAVASSARYDVFKLIDAALAGNAAQALQMYSSLSAEGSEEIPMLGAISRELRTLYQCATAIEQGNGIERVLENHRVWDKRKGLYKRCLSKHNVSSLAKLLQLAGRIDPALKGQSAENGPLLMTELVATLAGKTLLR